MGEPKVTRKDLLQMEGEKKRIDLYTAADSFLKQFKNLDINDDEQVKMTKGRLGILMRAVSETNFLLAKTLDSESMTLNLDKFGEGEEGSLILNLGVILSASDTIGNEDFTQAILNFFTELNH